MSRLPGYLYALERARWAVSRHRANVYFDHPNILTRRSCVRIDGSGKLILCAGFDIVANEVAVHAGATDDSFLVRLEQGVLDTNAEAVLVSSCGRVENAGETFALPGIDWLSVREGTDRMFNGVEVGADVRARIEHDLAAGYMVLVPRKPIKAGGGAVITWWRIDAANGQTLGMGEHGAGAATTEWALSEGFLARVVLTDATIFFCSVIASLDTSGLTIRDAVVCIGAGFAGGLSATSLATGFAALCAAVATGIWLNDSKGLDRKIL